MRLLLLNHQGLALAAVVFPPGYRIYTRTNRDAPSVLLASVPAGTASYDMTGLANGSIRYAHVKAVSACDVEDDDAVGKRKLVRVEIDDNGDLVGAVPNRPIQLRLERLASGRIVAEWTYHDAGQSIEPSAFNVYVATGSSAFDFDTPTHTVSYLKGKQSFSQDLGTFADGTQVRVVVRARSSANNEESNQVTATATSDATAPDAPSSLTVQVT